MHRANQTFPLTIILHVLRARSIILLELDRGPGLAIVEAEFASAGRTVYEPNLVLGLATTDLASYHGGPNQVLLWVVFTACDIAVDHQCPFLLIRNDVHAVCPNWN